MDEQTTSPRCNSFKLVITYRMMEAADAHGENLSFRFPNSARM